MIQLIPNIIFLIILIFSVGFFARNIKKVIKIIKLGKPLDRSDKPSIRLKNLLMVALGQSKMISRPISGILHIIVYLGFIIINIELLEIVIDGIFGTHRYFSKIFNPYLYNILIASFEIFAFLVIISVIIFWCRRNILKIKRFLNKEMNGWPKLDADNILYFEIILMLLFLSMNATDLILQKSEYDGYNQAGLFPVSSYLTPLFENFEL